MRRMGREPGLKVVFEAFPDRAYTPEGTLVPRIEKIQAIEALSRG